MATVTHWIIAAHNSDGDDIALYKKFGDENDVRAEIAKMIQEAKDANSDQWDDDVYIINGASVVTENPDGSLYGCAAFFDYHIDYTARREDEIPELGLEE